MKERSLVKAISKLSGTSCPTGSYGTFAREKNSNYTLPIDLHRFSDFSIFFRGR